MFPRSALLAAALAVFALSLSASAQTVRIDDGTPGSSLALVWVGRTLSEARQYDLADGYLRRGIERSPHWSLPRLERAAVSRSGAGGRTTTVSVSLRWPPS